MATVNKPIVRQHSASKWIIYSLVILLIACAAMLLAEHHRSALQSAENSALIPELGRFNLQFLVEKGISMDDYLKAVDQFSEQHRGSNLIEDYQTGVRASAAETRR